jgi:hypothetical protein
MPGQAALLIGPRLSNHCWSACTAHHLNGAPSVALSQYVFCLFFGFVHFVWNNVFPAFKTVVFYCAAFSYSMRFTTTPIALVWIYVSNVHALSCDQASNKDARQRTSARQRRVWFAPLFFTTRGMYQENLPSINSIPNFFGCNFCIYGHPHNMGLLYKPIHDKYQYALSQFEHLRREKRYLDTST